MDLPEILHEGQEGGANDLYEVLKKSDKTVSRESRQNRRVSMSLAKIRGKMKFEGSIGLSGSYPVYIRWICLKFCMMDRMGVLMICTKF